MSKYYKAEDVFHRFQRFFKAYAGWEKSQLKIILDDIPTIEVSEDCISREWLRDMFGLSEKTRKWGGDHSGYNTMMLYEIQDYIEDAPSVVPSRAEGEWIKETNEKLGKCLRTIYVCSACGCAVGCEYFVRRSYCPNCGAKMKGESK